jgi:hypothetical protein
MTLMKPRSAVFLLSIVTLCGGVYFTAKTLSSQAVKAQPGLGAGYIPYTLEQQTVAIGNSGAMEVTERRLVALKEDGSEIWISTFPNRPELGGMRRLVRSTGRMTVAIERIGATISQFLPASVIKAKRAIPSQAADQCRFPYETDRGVTLVAGVRVSTSEYLPGEGRRQTSWRALDFGCAIVKSRHERLIDGSWQLEVESVPIFFKGGPPSDDLFDESFFFSEMTPSEAHRRMYDLIGVTPSDCPRCFNPRYFEFRDAEYWRLQHPE